MALALVCDPCILESKSVTTSTYCFDCEENLCEECTKSHSRFKAFRSHRVLELKSIKSIPSTTMKYCQIHPDISLDFYCTQHDATCCGLCIAEIHRSCDKISSLDVASKDIKSSFLLLDYVSLMTDIAETLEKLLKNREKNLNYLKTRKSKIIQQISNAKSELIKHLDQLEGKLIAEVSTIQIKSEHEICELKSKLAQIQVKCNQNKEDLEFLKTHGSNTQLFLSLRQTIQWTEKTEDEVKMLSFLFREIDIEFHKNEKMEQNLIGSVSDIKRPCQVEYKPKLLQQAQTAADPIKSLDDFKVDVSVKLKSGEEYYITDMTITRDNNLLLCNWCRDYPKVYVYKDCKQYDKEIMCCSDPYGISVIPGTNTAAVTLPGDQSIQFINTTDLTKLDKVNINIYGYGVNATKDKIFVGGNGVVKILDSKGTDVNTIRVGTGDINSLYYKEDNEHMFFKTVECVCCCKEDGTVSYQYKAPGDRGLAVDSQGTVYVSMWETKKIHRLMSNGKLRDTVSTMGHPGVITFNNDFSKLFVAMNDNITIYKCK